MSNKLVMTITSDDRNYLAMVDAETEHYCEYEPRVSTYASILSSYQDTATMGVPPDGETVGDIVEERREDKKYVESGPIVARMVGTRVTTPLFFAQGGESIANPKFYNQIITILHDIRESLWSIQQTSLTTNAPTADQETLNRIFSKVDSVTIAGKR